MIIDTEKLHSDATYQEEQRFRFETDHFFAAEVMGFTKFNRRVHQPVVDLYFPKNRKLPIEEQDPIKFRMHLDPRKTFKTTMGLVDNAQWLAALGDKVTMLYETATQPLAASMMEVTIQHFGRGLLAQLYPEMTFTKRRREDCYDSDTRLEPSIDPTLGYTSPKSAQAGWHPYQISADDVCDAINSGISADDKVRQNLISVHNTNKNLLRAGGYLNIRGTRYHPFEIYGHELATMNPKKWKVLIRSSVTVRNGERLIPGEFPEEEDLTLNFAELPEMDYESLRDLFYAEYETFMCQQQNDPLGGSVPKFTEQMYQAALIERERIPPIGDTFLYWRPPYGGKPYMAMFDEGAMVRIAGGKVFVLDTWKGTYGPTSRAEKIVKALREHEADAVVIENAPGTEYIGADIRNEALRRNIGARVQWTEFEEDDHRREARMLQAEPIMKSGRLMFSNHMKHGNDCHKQFVNFGLIEENGIVDCIARSLERVPYSVMRANFSEQELEYQRRLREDAQFNAVFNQMGMPVVDEKQRQQAMATVLALESISNSGLPKLPGGLDG